MYNWEKIDWQGWNDRFPSNSFKINYQLIRINYQLITINYQLIIINYQLITIN